MTFFILPSVVTFLVGLVLIHTKRVHGHWSLDTAFGVQNHHTSPTPRVGGIAVMVGLIVGWVVADLEERSVLTPLLLSSIPAFVFGLAEDISKKVGVLPRLLATMVSGVILCLLTGLAMQNTGVLLVDWVLAFTPLAVVFTAFAVGGVANAINIIDGFNGLASGAVAIMLSALGFIAYSCGDHALANVCLLLVLGTLGFVAVNWPFGKIFLGDGGAYLLGFLLASVAVLLPMRNPQVSALTTLLVCSYPVLEVVFSVLRRRRREGHHPGQPDKVHLHHLVHRRVVCQRVPTFAPEIKNGLTSPVCWAFVAAPATWAAYFAFSKPMLVLGFFLAFAGYALTYKRLSQFTWSFGVSSRM